VSKLEQLARIGTLRSCSEYARYGLETSGDYTIDPDGPLLGHQPFKVFCNFTSGSTEIYHDTEDTTTIEKCHDPGCYNKTITYVDGDSGAEVPLSQIVSLIELSEYCEQSFDYDCNLAPLRNQDIDFAFWEDRHGETNNYFTGSNYGNHTCDCFYEEDGCIESETLMNTCNCDSNLPAPLHDSGIITNMTALPLTKLYFGGLNYDVQSGTFLLGRLKCYGEQNVAVGTSCADLKKSGVFKSGHYAIRPEGSHQQKIVFCDMSSGTYDDVLESRVLNFAPIGTILPWVPKINILSKKLLHLPPGWLYCNGSDITEGPWTGGKTPDLNGPGLFLRGGDEDSVLETENHQMQDHEHVDGGHSHTCSAISSSSSDSSLQHRHIETAGPVEDCGDNCIKQYVVHDYESDPTTTSTTTTTTCSLSSQDSNIGGVATGANTGGETRPSNMKVIYIIRVY